MQCFIKIVAKIHACDHLKRLNSQISCNMRNLQKSCRDFFIFLCYSLFACFYTTRTLSPISVLRPINHYLHSKDNGLRWNTKNAPCNKLFTCFEYLFQFNSLLLIKVFSCMIEHKTMTIDFFLFTTSLHVFLWSLCYSHKKIEYHSEYFTT